MYLPMMSPHLSVWHCPCSKRRGRLNRECSLRRAKRDASMPAGGSGASVDVSSRRPLAVTAA